MLFNSPQFLFLFLPLVLTGYLVVQRFSAAASVWWLLLCSLMFYGSWNIWFLPILLGSMAFNYAATIVMQRSINRLPIIVVAIVANLALLFYFKYSNFLLGTVSDGFDLGLDLHDIVLPLGISFFTFQQIAHLVDVYRSEAHETNLARYALFISFFPHLIAGPLTHHGEMMPQFGRSRENRLQDLSMGGSLLVAGLVKKVVIADTVAVPASAMFDAAAGGAAISATDAWMGAICYALQIYFDFSAYSDMAIGIARMMGIDFPINFASPYKATSIADFWRRWHITLSRFLRDYVYIALGGNRQGASRTRLNLFATMVIGGVWHGAGWTFLLWGLLHGLFLLLHQLWRAMPASRMAETIPLWPIIAQALTLLVVVIAWVPFRAVDLDATLSVWRSMALLNSPDTDIINGGQVAVYILGFGGVALLAPNLYQLLAEYRVGLPSKGYPATFLSASPLRFPWAWSVGHAAVLGVAFAFVVLKLTDISEFIYFQF